jgi:hypothetical protein
MPVTGTDFVRVLEDTSKLVLNRMGMRYGAGDMSAITSAIELLVELTKTKVSEVQVAPGATATGTLDLSGSALEDDDAG